MSYGLQPPEYVPGDESTLGWWTPNSTPTDWERWDSPGYTDSPANAGYSNNSGTTYAPSDINPWAKTFGDVLSFGIARYFDSHKADPIKPANTQPVLVGPARTAGSSGGQSNVLWLILAGLGVYLLAK